MNHIFYMARMARTVFKSRAFAVSVLSVLMSLTVYAVSATNNTVYVRADQQTEVFNTSARELEDILADCGISVSPHDVVDFSGFDGNVAEINITRAFPVVIRVDKTTYRVMMTEGTVADALKKAGVTIDDDDLVSHPLYEFLEENERIFINRIDYRTTSYEEEIPYEVETRVTPLLRAGKSRLLQEGAVGKKVLTYGETTKDGVVEEAQLLGENIVLRPTTQIHLVGGNVPVSPSDFGYSIVNNAPTTYKSVITNARATGYSAGGNAHGASGNSLSAGHVAVNPNLIPYGSKLYITSADGSFVYGYAIASDTGTGLLEGIIDVDLFYDTYLESVLNGLRIVNIYVLE
ncbi:MAG: G5 domain-containing protein [Oscillospiraceae bacterium]|nr:G5 domain-containing protein [Oscillospiraceae bacterium]